MSEKPREAGDLPLALIFASLASKDPKGTLEPVFEDRYLGRAEVRHHELEQRHRQHVGNAGNVGGVETETDDVHARSPA